MTFLSKLLKVVAMIPSLVFGIEAFSQTLGQSKNGKDKAQAVIDFSQFALGFANQIAPSEIVDASKFHEGLQKINDGVVECLNASIWNKKSPVPITPVPNPGPFAPTP